MTKVEVGDDLNGQTAQCRVAFTLVTIHTNVSDNAATLRFPGARSFAAIVTNTSVPKSEH
jgi:hypothetical protein